jgi:hypothetical protein
MPVRGSVIAIEEVGRARQSRLPHLLKTRLDSDQFRTHAEVRLAQFTQRFQKLRQGSDPESVNSITLEQVSSLDHVITSPDQGQTR